MKKTMLFLLAIFFLPLFSCSNKVDSETDKQALIKLTVEDWDENAKTRNIEAMVESYIDGALRIGKGEVLNGKEAIRNSLSYLTDRGTPDKLENKVEDIKLSGDLAVVRGSFEAVISPKEGGAKIHERGAWVDVCERQENGDWKMALTLYTDVGDGNKRIASLYHELNPDNMDMILTEDFIGRNEKNRYSWNKEKHKNYWTNNKGMATDKIYHQIAEGDWVATWFIRTGEQDGETISGEMMHFKRFEDGKIAEIWEYGDSRQWDSE